MPLNDRLRPWAAPAAWCGLILVATSVPLPTGELPATDLPLDKVGHLVLYAGLGWTLGRALIRSGWPGTGPRVGAWAGGLAFAALDEWHQHLVATRVPSTADWMADAAGLTLGLAAVAVAARMRSGTARGGGRTRSTRSETDAGSGRGDGTGPAAERDGTGGDEVGRSRHRDGKDPFSDE